MNIFKKMNIRTAVLIVFISCSIFLFRYYFVIGNNGKLPIIEKAANFELINQDNKSISLTNLRGKSKVLSFMYSSCVMATMCPMTLRKFQQVQASLKDKLDEKTVFLLVTFDPEKDTPGLLKKYGELYDVDFHNWHFLTGEKQVLEKVLDDYQIIAEKQESGVFRHSMITFIIDKRNNLRKMYVGNAWDPEDIKEDLISLLGGRYES